MNHRLLNVPICRARMAWQKRMQRTLRVQIREKGSLPLTLTFGSLEVVLDVDLGKRDSSSWLLSPNVLVGESSRSSGSTAM